MVGVRQTMRKKVEDVKRQNTKTTATTKPYEKTTATTKPYEGRIVYTSKFGVCIKCGCSLAKWGNTQGHTNGCQGGGTNGVQCPVNAYGICRDSLEETMLSGLVAEATAGPTSLSVVEIAQVIQGPVEVAKVFSRVHPRIHEEIQRQLALNKGNPKPLVLKHILAKK